MSRKVSVIISARNESPQIAWTLYSLMQDLEATLDCDWEVILVDNGSIDDTSDYFLPRGMTNSRFLKIMIDPIMGNVSARNKGVEIANGDYIFFADAHMAIKRGTFKYMLDAMDRYPEALIHSAVGWMGSWPAKPSYQYTLCVGEKFWGRWNRIRVAKEPFAIPLSGHCFLGMMKDQFQKLRGYHNEFRVYGGGENYLDNKWWIMGYPVLTEPRAMVWHSRYGRGYTYYGPDLAHNQMLAAYTVGGEKWAERVLIANLNKKGQNMEQIHRLYNEALEEGKEDRAWIEERQVRSFDEMLKERTWDKWNEDKHGKSRSNVVVFDDWLERLRTDEAKKVVRESEFIV